MSLLTINNFIDAGMKSLEDKNYWSALSIALMLPSMCSRISYNDDKHKKMNGNFTDKKCYIDWCKEYIKSQWLITCLGSNYAEVLYKMRCDLVHAGTMCIDADKKGVFFYIGGVRDAYELNKYKLINVVTLCNEIFCDVKVWCSNNRMYQKLNTYYFDMNIRDDELLLRKLCDDDRANHLKEQFERKNNKK